MVEKPMTAATDNFLRTASRIPAVRVNPPVTPHGVDADAHSSLFNWD